MGSADWIGYLILLQVARLEVRKQKCLSSERESVCVCLCVFVFLNREELIIFFLFSIISYKDFINCQHILLCEDISFCVEVQKTHCSGLAL